MDRIYLELEERGHIVPQGEQGRDSIRLIDDYLESITVAESSGFESAGFESLSSAEEPPTEPGTTTAAEVRVAPKAGTFAAYLESHELGGLFGEWRDDSTKCSVSISLHPSHQGASITWKHPNGEVFGVLHGDKKIAEPKKPSSKDSTEKTVATGDFVAEDGCCEPYKMVAEFRFNASGKTILERKVWIVPKSKTKCPKHTLAIFSSEPNPGLGLIHRDKDEETVISTAMKKTS